MVELEAPAVAALLVELSRRTALAGNNYFQARAYLRAADSLAALPEPLARVVTENRLRQISGIGTTIADIVGKLHQTGTHPLLEKLRRDVPEGVLEMLSVPGLKPEKIKRCRETRRRSRRRNTAPWRPQRSADSQTRAAQW